jgi:anti-anti-sigma regulatory factor
MNINSERIDGVLVVAPEGRLDAYGALALDEALDDIIRRRFIHFF